MRASKKGNSRDKGSYSLIDSFSLNVVKAQFPLGFFCLILGNITSGLGNAKTWEHLYRIGKISMRYAYIVPIHDSFPCHAMFIRSLFTLHDLTNAIMKRRWVISYFYDGCPCYFLLFSVIGSG